MFTAPHRIRRQRWTVHTGSAAEAFAWRQLLRDQGQDLLLPLLETAFDAAASGDRVIHLPKLELKVIINAVNQPPEGLLELIAQQLREQLPIALRAAAPPSLTTSWQESAGPKSRFDILLHYLRCGSVPWQEASATAAERASALTATCRAAWPQLLDYLRGHLESSPFYFRLLQLLSAAEGISLISALAERLPPPWRTMLVRWGSLVFEEQDTPPSRYRRFLLSADLLSKWLPREERTVSPKFFSLALEAIPPDQRQVWHELLASLPELAGFLPQPQTPDVVREGEPTSVAAEMSEPSHEVSPEEGTTADAGRHRALFPPTVSEPLPPFEPDFSRDQRPSADLFPLLVQQAGLILLHPFIPRFFENTAVIEPGNPRLPAAALPRAAALLHFLATGADEVYEFELGLIKVLLGLHPESPLPICRGLVESADQEEAEGLLQAAITHWSALKNTSSPGLRAAFLQRRALLREADYGWQLHVERRPFDLLLEQLPWSISIVKLPWMTKAIYTEW